MTRIEALRILGLERGVSEDDVKKAYRRRAFETHPDRGGSAVEFLKVQVAYEILNAAGEAGYSGSELDSALLDRLDEVHAAFVRLGEEGNAFCDHAFSVFDQDLASTIISYRSYDILKANAQRDISSLWSNTVAALVAFLEEKVALIADHHESWLQEYLRPAVDAARYENPPRWFERKSSAAIAVGAAVALIVAAIYLRDGWIGLPAVLLCASGVILPIKYRRRFDARRIIKGVHLKDATAGARLGRLGVERDRVGSGDASFGGAAFGAAFGSILGPLGSLAGGVFGAVVGWFLGESLDERKQKLYDSVVEDANRVIPDMLQEFDRRLGETEEAMIRAIKENFRRNVRAVVALMRG